MTEAEPLQQVNRTYVRQHGRTLSYFSGCDYFRLSSHPAVLQALQVGLKRYGLNVAASRLTSGNHKLFLELEKKIAQFFHAPAALLTSSGYVGNIVVAQGLAGQFSHALLDEKAHVSIQDAAQFLNCPILKFKHRDPDDLARALKRCGPHTRPIVLTDGMFSHDGSVTPLRAYLKVLPRDGMILVDDAHGGGTVGKTGGGTLEVEGVGRERIVHCVTLSKSFGVYGGAVLCSKPIRQILAGKSHLFAGNTPLPLPLAAGALRAIDILRSDKSLRRRLYANADFVKNALRAVGYDLPEKPGPIVPVHPRRSRDSEKLKKMLRAAKIYPPFVKYPGGPAAGYFRFVISSEHKRSQLDALVRVLTAFKKSEKS